ncbi:polysaccharide biosynthesis protein [Riemerella anatipestifer]|uniref:lipopolysaccharide biosynthesis protein n=1 Tax=Riemerella anatipestifer TaxID=34085 RepID=UPI00129D59A7|nr:oligosaccharide flippase family protein [Riemerella anatipestifer]MRM94241.1 polysaccharide biosynthesis protein [Riemerella anatipestifer]
MNVIARQGIKYSIIGYLGFIIGTLSSIFLFPNDYEFYGKLRYILPMAETFLPIIVFGISFSNVKFFFSAEKQGFNQSMLSLSLLAVVFNFIVFSGAFFLACFLFPSLKETQFWNMKYLILPLLFLLSISSVLNKYISNYKRIAIPNIFENLFPKIANIGAFSLFFFLGVPEYGALAFFLGVFVLSLAGYFWYNKKLTGFKWDFSTQFFRTNNTWKKFLEYSFYGFLGNIGNYIAIKIDNVMISEFLNFTLNGVYSNIYSILQLIAVPAMGLYTIYAPLINQCFEENDMAKLQASHQKTSLNLFCIGIILYTCLLSGFPFLGQMIKNGNELLDHQYLLWILGPAILFDLATGFNGHIISMSKYFKFNIVVMLFLAFATVGLNLVFLRYTDLGIMGIALATAISLTTFNIIKIIFNRIYFGVFPLSLKMLYMSLLCSGTILLTYNLPALPWAIIDFIYRPALALTIILLGNYMFKIYPTQQLIAPLLKKLKR